MRPENDVEPVKVYECFTCGARVEDTSAGNCNGCGGEFRHLGRPRDL